MTTIRHRLTGHLLLGWTLLLSAGLFAAYLLARTALTRQFDDAIQAKAMALSALFEQTEGNIELELPVQFMREFDAQGSTTLFQIWRTDGTVLRRSKSLHGDSLPLRYGTLPKPDCWDLPLPNGAMARAVGFKYQPQPADENRKIIDPFEAILVMAVNRRELDNTLKILALVLGGCGLLMLALSAATLPLLLRRELAPLHFLTEETMRIDAHSLSTRFSNEGLPGELIPITTCLNDLLERLQTAFERERQFSADLAHEMRTPLAEIRSLAELAVRWPDTRDADFDRHILAVTIQMEGILTRLLAIARSERGPVPVSFEPICLSDLIVTIYQSLETRASARGIAFKANESATFVIQSDPILWRMILSNLLENSIEYSPSGATVRAHCEAKAGQFTLTVINPVEHLQIADLPHLGERFWRKDAARSNRGHSGLGLSLVRALTSAMGCRLEAAMNHQGELSMAVIGPIGQPSANTPPMRTSVITETKNTNVKP